MARFLGGRVVWGGGRHLLRSSRASPASRGPSAVAPESFLHEASQPKSVSSRKAAVSRAAPRVLVFPRWELAARGLGSLIGTRSVFLELQLLWDRQPGSRGGFPT